MISWIRFLKKIQNDCFLFIVIHILMEKNIIALSEINGSVRPVYQVIKICVYSFLKSSLHKIMRKRCRVDIGNTAC